MPTRTAVIIGSTGLIGSELVAQLQRLQHFDILRLVVRKPLQTTHPKIEAVVVDFSDYNQLENAIAGAECVFCAIGTTRKATPDPANYRKVDYDIPVNTSRICGETGVRKLLVVSSIGADSKSRNFYLRLKGEMEEALQASKIPSVAVFRPSLLLGNRSEFRGGERVFQAAMKIFSPVIPANYKAIEASVVARAMISVSLQENTGFRIFTYREMNSEANSFQNT